MPYLCTTLMVTLNHVHVSLVLKTCWPVKHDLCTVLIELPVPFGMYIVVPYVTFTE